MKKNISMVDIAHTILEREGKGINFYDLYDQVAVEMEMTDQEKVEKESDFYTNITLDGQFITTGENNWDLRERHKFEDVHIDMNDIYSDEDEEVDDADDNDADSTIEDDYS